MEMPNESDVSRRNFLLSTAGAALALSVLPAAGAAVDSTTFSRDEFDRMVTEISNWGRWGKDDQMGTVNLITAAKRKQAAALIREGLSVSLSHTYSTEKFVDNPNPLVHVMGSSGETPGAIAAVDTYTMNYHGPYFTHMDALSHFFWNGHTYNGYPQTVVTSAGAQKLDIDVFKNGIVTRGILMDVPRSKGLPYLEPGSQIHPEDLDACEKQAGIKVASGDMIFIRTGRWGRRAKLGPWDLDKSIAGIYPTCARWLKQRDVAVLATDAVSDVMPSPVPGVPFPIHVLTIVALGTPIFDNCDLEELSETANRLHRWEFMLTTAPMRIPTGTGSPLNPLAIF
jgi:kynurenine formamidase